MAEQLAYRGLALRSAENRLVAVEAFEHLELAELREQGGNLGVEIEPALLDQLQRGDARYRLGRGRVTKHRAVIDRRAASAAERAGAAAIEHAAAVGDDQRCARIAPRLSSLLKQPIDRAGVHLHAELLSLFTLGRRRR